MNDIKNILLVLFGMLGWGSIFFQAHSLDEWRSKTDLEIFLLITLALTGAHLDDIFYQEFDSLSSSEFWELKILECFLDTQLLFEMEFSGLD
jgi:hypothetical protein